jgi:glucose-6-phosphate isomerase
MKLSGPILKNIDSKILLSLQEIAPRVAKKDINIWGNKSEAANRLNWVDLPTKSRDLLPELDALSAWARSNGLTQIILCGMGGSSLAPEVIAASYKKQLTTLDSTDPIQILDSLPNEIKKTVVVIGSKSGTTIETLSQFEFYQRRFKEADLNPIQHIVIITDPGTPLDISARNLGYKVVNADPNVGGRFSALSAFGLVPAALIGVDISLLLDDAEKLSSSISVKESPAIAIAACLYSLTDQIINFCDKGSVTPGLSNWIEQLIAESTGKDLTGRLPVVIEDMANAISGITIGFNPGEYDLVIEATLGEQFILWEWVTALLCYLLKVDPFNQPNVTEAKDRTSAILLSLKSKGFDTPTPTYEDSDYLIYSNQQINNIPDFLKSNVTYFAVLAYLARGIDDEIYKIRKLIAAKSKTATTFGWGPRYLHSTGQFHKGGQQNGAFIVITGDSGSDIEIPNRDYTFSQLIMAQALADIESISERNLPVIRIHLKDRKKAIARLISDLEKN